MWVAGDWVDYELLGAGDGEKLERWGPYILRRPDPQAVWPAEKTMSSQKWQTADAVYHRSKSGGGSWEYKRELPPIWEINYKGLRFGIKPMQFKHTGVFPEQAVNWDWIINKLNNHRDQRGQVSQSGQNSQSSRRADIRVLSLFAYTGAATIAAASAGALVCHVDAARGIVAMAKDNAARSLVPGDRIRYIVDDVMKFVRRELRRGTVYDAVIMDPPAYGRGPGGELWKAETHLYEIVELCAGLLEAPPLFFIINSYAAGIPASSVGNILKFAIGGRFGGAVECAEMGIRAADGNFVLPCGCCARWERG